MYLREALSKIENNESAELNLNRVIFSVDDASSLVVDLQKYPTKLRKLTLANHNFDNEKGVAILTIIAEALPKLTALTHFFLWSNEIGEKGAAILGKALPSCTSLTTLGVYDRGTKAQTAKAVISLLQKIPALTEFNLFHTALEEESVQILAHVLPTCKLTSLHMRNCELSGEKLRILTTALRNCEALKTIGLIDNNLGDPGIETLAAELPHCRLSEIYLGANKITDKGTKTLATLLPQCPGLRFFALDCNNITEHGVNTLLALQISTYLLLNNNAIPNEMLSAVTALMEQRQPQSYLQDKFGPPKPTY